ncbi:MAG: signal peptide peptidase SppA [Pirellulaceae bacterium]|jgi:protease-4|nr:signal peptide peptidase SppA [Pirellulaceae bacterium]
MERQQQQPIIIQQSSGSGFFAKIGWLGFIVCAGFLIRHYFERDAYFDSSGGIQEKFHSGSKRSSTTDKVAIISITGIIGSGDGVVKQQIDRVRADEDVKAVVLRVDSPGGTVTGSDYIYHHLKKLKADKDIPFVVSMGSMAASGGYYVSMAVGDERDSIFAEPTTLTGSIGVIIPHYDVSGLLDQYAVKNDSISSHPRKQMLSMTRAMSAEDRQIIQRQVDEMLERFVGIVKEGRPEFRVDGVQHDGVNLATGEVFTAPSALEFGLVDKIGFIEDAIDRALELAKLNRKTARIVKYKSIGSLFDIPLMQSLGNQSSELDLLFELSTPRAYYLSTTLPPFISSRRLGLRLAD